MKCKELATGTVKRGKSTLERMQHLRTETLGEARVIDAIGGWQLFRRHVKRPKQKTG
jgi:hypothetical protein